MPYGKDTKQRILNTAISLFGQHGKDGVSTTEIARNAEVNKALIFYYFGSKNNLYKLAFRNLLKEFVKTIREKISSVDPGLSVIETFVRENIAVLKEKKTMVNFMIRELIMTGDELSPELQEYIEVFKPIRNDLLNAISLAKSKGEMRNVDPLHTIVNIISLNYFFYLGESLVRLVNQNIDMEDFENKRVEHVLDLIMNGLRKNTEQS